MTLDRKPRISLFEYQDYQKFLVDYFKDLRARIPSLSYQKIQNELGLSSKSQVFRLVKGQLVHFNTNLMNKLCAYMDFNQLEEDYFESLIRYSTAKDEHEKEKIKKNIQAIISTEKPKLLTAEHQAFLKDMNAPALRELLPMFSNVPSTDHIAEQFYVPISKQEIEESISTLINLKLIGKEKNQFHQTSHTLSNNSKITTSFVRDYQLKIFEKSIENLAFSDTDQQHLGAQTFSINQKGFLKLKKRISDFVQDVVRIVNENDEDSEQVYQLNLQLFPLTKKQKLDRKKI